MPGVPYLRDHITAIPALWNKSVIIPVPKLPCPWFNNFRPVALTSVVMKCFKRIAPLPDPYRHRGCSYQCNPLDKQAFRVPNAYARVVFTDFSSAFNTVQPHLPVKERIHMVVKALTI